MAGVAMIGASAVGAAGQAWGASQAASAQGKAGRLAMIEQEKKYQQARKDFDPYMQLGQQGAATLGANLDELIAPIKMDQATLESTPGYQFNRRQGLKAVQNSAAARGLGVSGAALKGAAEFATGLADNTYQQQFANENTNRTNAYNRLMGVTQIGTGATTALTGAGTTTGQGIASSQVGIGNAQAAGYNAMGQAVGNFANNVGGWAAYKGLYGNKNA